MGNGSTFSWYCSVTSLKNTERCKISKHCKAIPMHFEWVPTAS
ncbi:uncharacterized protein METZ01_LOCUS356657 [marine metagenome]|uniref:Uncharacterized protein n=1 Tax=marine metagenome TaxID=408172 RepID=A0A382S1R0_9ZZZZ